MPQLTELPHPPAARQGWPWIASSARVPLNKPEGGAWPKISIVTPSFNQGRFLEETIRSVLLQNYPNLEYIVIDGGSTDGSVDLIKRYEPWLTAWVSEPDAGQSHAINKGLALSTGTIFNWINSDDMLSPNALHSIALSFKDCDVVAGGCANFTEGVDEEHVKLSSGLVPSRMIRGDSRTVFQQPAFWMRREGIQECGGIDESLHYIFDLDLAVRFLSLFPRVVYLPDVLARFRLHPESKTISAAEMWGSETPAWCRKLLKLDQFAAIHKSCDVRLREVSWWDKLGRLKSETSASRWRRTVNIARDACLDPRVRWTRMTLGAARQTLTGER